MDDYDWTFDFDWSGGLSNPATSEELNQWMSESGLPFVSNSTNFQDIWNRIKSVIGTKGGAAATAAGVAGLINMLGLNEPNIVGGSGGYQGYVPLYTGTREQITPPEYKPYAQFDPTQSGAYRPGQGGITYFTPMQYSTVGFEPKTAHEFITGAPVSALPEVPPADDGSATEPPPGTEPTWPNGSPRAYASGGITMLARGGRFLKGRGDGVSDDIPAVIHNARGGQPAKLADGEFVIPARVVAEIGNGSSEAGARKLYAMLDRIEALGRRAKRGQPSGADKELKKLA